MILQKSYSPFSRYWNVSILNDPMAYQICDVIMSISTWDRVYFWIYLLKHNSLSHQTRPVDRYKQGQNFSRIFWTILRTGDKFQVLFNFATCSNFSIGLTIYVQIPVFHFSEKLNLGQLKMVNFHYISCYLAILKKS